ncbi:MAG: hypothetical protein HY912_11315 [Desulfomonile tiedjei]|uniref:Uncharacterized protein n=1 Tax=Desulfomonile tiedjei TaxID=2358 RepID=A0A9D6V0Z3_9BACT|nr:hypothetical protein [Desulfomonile tiedjei]
MNKLSEIRSTIDIMMEKTKGLAMSPEERESIRREAMLKKAKGYKLKLLENPSAAQDVLSSLRQEIPDDRNLIEAFLWKVLVEGLPASEEILKYLDVMEAIAPDNSSILRDLRTAFKSGVKDRISDKKKIIQKEKKKLAVQGISGSAVVPKLPKDIGDDDNNFSAVLEKFKAELLYESPA